MVEEGDRLAVKVKAAMTRRDSYISGTQLGITVSSVALGWIGVPALALLVDRGLVNGGLAAPPVAAYGLSAAIIAFVVITFMHVVLGELAPKSVALIRPEATSRWIARPLLLFSKVMTPFVWLLHGAATRLLRAFGISPASDAHHAHSAEELRLIVTQARAHGTIDESDSAMLAGVLEFHEKRADDVMRPRTDVAALPVDSTEAEVRELLRSEGYSRYPVYRDTLDDIVGVFLARDYWLRDETKKFVLASSLRESLFVPDSRPAELVLADLRRTRAHMAIVLDEYGGTAGIVTMEDLVEEVVGDIADEYDLASRDAILTDGVLELAGNLSLADANSDHRLRIPEGDWTTLGGYVFSRLGRLPRMGDRASYPGGELEVVAMDGRRVAAVRVHGNGAPPMPPAPGRR